MHLLSGCCPLGKFDTPGLDDGLDPEQRELLAAVDIASTGNSDGLGDDVAKLIHRAGIYRAAKLYQWAVGKKDCGCNARRKWLNRWWPYKRKPYRVVAGMATFPERYTSAMMAITSLAPQVDRLFVWGNGYDRVPHELDRFPNVTFVPAGNVDLMAAGKHVFTGFVSSEHWLYVDDDFVFPFDYAARMLDGVMRHGCPVSLHGCSWPTPVTHWSTRTANYACLSDVASDAEVQLGGTGVMCIRSDHLEGWDFSAEVPYSTATDLMLAHAIRRRGHRIMVLAHKRDYLTYVRPRGFSIFNDVTRPTAETLMPALLNGINAGTLPRMDEPLLRPLSEEIKQLAVGMVKMLPIA